MIKRFSALLLSAFAVSTACFATKADGYECSEFVGAASFQCSKASTPIEKAICSNKDLRVKDCLFGYVYRYTLRDAGSEATEKQLRSSQIEWIKARSKECSGKDGNELVSCINRSTSSRALELITKYKAKSYGVYAEGDFALSETQGGSPASRATVAKVENIPEINGSTAEGRLTVQVQTAEEASLARAGTPAGGQLSRGPRLAPCSGRNALENDGLPRTPGYPRCRDNRPNLELDQFILDGPTCWAVFEDTRGIGEGGVLCAVESKVLSDGTEVTLRPPLHSNDWVKHGCTIKVTWGDKPSQPSWPETYRIGGNKPLFGAGERQLEAPAYEIRNLYRTPGIYQIWFHGTGGGSHSQTCAPHSTTWIRVVDRKKTEDATTLAKIAKQEQAAEEKRRMGEESSRDSKRQAAVATYLAAEAAIEHKRIEAASVEKRRSIATTVDEAAKKGKEYAQKSPTKWKLSSRLDPLSGKTQNSAHSETKFGKGALLMATVDCRMTPIAGIQPVLELSVHNGGEFPFKSQREFTDCEGLCVSGRSRVNESVSYVRFKKDSGFSNVAWDYVPFAVARDRKAEFAGLMTRYSVGTLNDPPVYAAMIEVQTNYGPVVVDLPPYDSSIRKVVEGCVVGWR